MAEGEALHGPCDDGSLSRHLLDIEPLNVPLYIFLATFVTLTLAAEKKKGRESGSDKQPHTCSPVALGSIDGVYLYDPCPLPALALWALT